MTQPLDSNVALVTGASSGIGAATALALADLGARIVLLARRADRLEELAATVRTRGGVALPLVTDITDRRQVDAAVASTMEEFGRLDVVVNNAGLMLLDTVESARLSEWDRMLAVNVTGLLNVTHASLPHLLHAAAKPADRARGDRGTADVVNISSVAGRVTYQGMSVYNLTKHGVGAFSDSLRQEVARHHVRVSVVEPGPVDTELASHLRPEAITAVENPFGSAQLHADDVAETVAHIVSRPARVMINKVLLRPGGSGG